MFGWFTGAGAAGGSAEPSGSLRRVGSDYT